MKTTKMLSILVLALGLTAEVAKADFTFGTPTNLGPTVNSLFYDALASISADGLSLYFSSDRPGGYGRDDIWMTTRKTKSDPWSTPVNLGPTVNSSRSDHCARISADGLSLYYSSKWPGGYGQMDTWVTTRETTEDDWGTPVNLGPTVNSSSEDWAPSLSTDGLTLFFESDRPGGSGGWDIWVTTRATKNDDWSAPMNLGPTVNSADRDGGPYISADGRTLFFFSDRPGGYGNWDLWVTTRETTNDPWSAPVNLGPTVNSLAVESVPSISPDGREIYFSERRTALRPGGLGGGDIWQAPILPIVDFNGDGIVNSADMCLMVDHWHTDESFYDIGPMPWGDGIVDVQDLIVLAEHLFEDVNDPTLVAHWALDETEGSIAHDSAGDNDAYISGDPVWQPTGGQIDGALAFDGTDDYVSTDFILNPADGAFRVFAWIKGGGPGQVIISQIGEANWLSADPSGGNLMTGLEGFGRGRGPLVSQTGITDGGWHRVGLTWDGSNRILYADDVEVARDTQPALGSSEGGLYIGAGKNLEPGSFWSGLIDDVRIYDRAITP